MEGVTTAIVAFLFVCVVLPSLIKNKPQYYGALGMVVAIILLQGLSAAIGSAGFAVFANLVTAVLQVGAILVLILAAGGLSVRDLAGDLKNAYEVIRRGEEDKQIIIPRTGEMPRQKEPDEARPVRIELDLPNDKDIPKSPPPKDPAKGIPLE